MYFSLALGLRKQWVPFASPWAQPAQSMLRDDPFVDRELLGKSDNIQNLLLKKTSHTLCTAYVISGGSYNTLGPGPDLLVLGPRKKSCRCSHQHFSDLGFWKPKEP